MARTIENIRNEIIAAKNSYPSLDPLDSPSAVAEWLLWVDVVAEAIRTEDIFLDQLIIEIDAEIAAQQIGTASWYQLQCFKFQLGDDLQDDGTYTTIDETKQIITRVSVVETATGILLIKVAKGEIGSEEALNSTELAQFAEYMEQIKFAGTILSVISLNADEMRVTATVYYDALFSIEQMQQRVRTNLETYMETGIPFDGVVLKSAVVDAIQTTDGIVDITIEELMIRSGLIETIVDREKQLVSGYVKEAFSGDIAGTAGTAGTNGDIIIDDESFEATITYIPSTEGGGVTVLTAGLPKIQGI